MEIHPEETPVSLQLFGSEPDIMAETAARIEERRLPYWISIWAARCQRW